MKKRRPLYLTALSVSLLCTYGSNCQAQQPPPSAGAVEWVSPYTHEDERSESGKYYSHYYDATIQRYRNEPLPLSAQHYGDPQSRAESGEDWFYGHENIMIGGNFGGFITAGYSSWPNCWWAGPEYCSRPNPLIGEPLNNNGDWRPNIEEFEKVDYRKGHTRGLVAQVDPDGEEVWYRHLFPGQIWNAIQTSDGGFLCAGVAYTSRWPSDSEMGDELTIRMNDDLVTDINLLECSVFTDEIMSSMGYVAKLSETGDVLWCTMLNSATSTTAGLLAGGEMHDVVEVNGVNGVEYWVVGRSTPGDNLPYVARLDVNGVRLGYATYSSAAFPALPAEWPDMDEGVFMSIEKDPSSELVLISGWYRASGTAHALAMVVEAGTGDLLPSWYVDAGRVGGPLDLLGGHDPSLTSYATGGGFVPLADETTVVIPVLANFSFGNTYSGPKEATLLVHGFQPDGTLTWTTDLEAVRAYDLQADMQATADGKVAVVSSKWGAEQILQGWQLPTETFDCLVNDFGEAPDGATHDWAFSFNYNYWNTDAYVAKLNPVDGTVIWETSWDADPTSTFECSPGDLRNQECVYKITEAPGGGLVLSGNTSHNFDDYYLVKLNDCQSSVEYDFVVLEAVAGSVDHSYTLASDEIWDADKNIVGTIIIPDGLTLTISDCTIRFADSEQVAWPTRIVVENGGKLIVQSSTLTSITSCPNSLWDGILVQGDEFASQLWQPGGVQQGVLEMKYSTISNARMGAVAANEFFTPPLAPQPGARSGGIITAYDCQFINNRWDVAFSPYENHGVILPEEVWPNLSYFTLCRFVTQGDMPKAGDIPREHVFMSGVRRIAFQGCTWGNDMFGSQPDVLPSDQGQGIESINSTFVVADHCGSWPDPGVPCPSQDLTHSSFFNLHRGIQAVTFDPSKTFSVDNTTFTGTNYAIRMEGVQDASITRCEFNVPTPLTSGIVGVTYGVYSDECTGYRIQENSFYTSQPGAPRKVGLIIKDSGSDYNTFYNNSFENLYTGSILQGVNADANDETGLEVKCNDYGLVDQNTFDVALTGGVVRVQKMQGQPITDQFDQTQWKNPAGNRFSVDHTGSGDPEEDWHVQVTATIVEYFHHTPSPGNRTKPSYSDVPNEIGTTDQSVFWPAKEIACPSELHEGDTKEEKRLLAEGEHGEYEASKDAYDANKDNGDTYSLLGYVSDPTKSSAQVRNALQSVAPKVSAEVWQAAFERTPAMSAWHITQGLLSNSPLQSDVLRMVDEYALPSSYAAMVLAAQTGDVNILTQLASAVARHGGNKAEALSDLGRMSWLDSLDLGGSLDSLRLFHEALPANNHALAIGGVLAAQADYSALETLALAEEIAGDATERYAVLKHFAQLEQQQGWSEADANLRTWLSGLGQQRDVVGSTWANAWLHALGEDLPEEVIILPETGPKSAGRNRTVQAVQWAEEDVLEVFPNPAINVAYVVFDFGASSSSAQLRLLDVNGRQLSTQIISGAQGIATLPLEGVSAGVYIIEVVRPEQPSHQTRLVVQ